MDDNSGQLSHQNGGGQIGGIGVNSTGQMGSNNSGMNNKQLGGDDNQANQLNGQQYSIPGILHFIQHEFSRFEIERSQWDVDRTELQVIQWHTVSYYACVRLCVSVCVSFVHV